MITLHKEDVLSREENFDVISYPRSSGMSRKIYLSRGDHLPRKIEYFGSDGEIAAVTKLSEYTKCCNSSAVPTKVSIVHLLTNTTADITLKNVKFSILTIERILAHTL